MSYVEVEGNLITKALSGEYAVITHGCNCFCTMGAGIAPQMAKAFGADKFPLEHPDFRGSINKLGMIDYKEFLVSSMSGAIPADYKGVMTMELKAPLYVVNSYTQYGFGANHANGSSAPLDYAALTLCLKKINKIFPGLKIGLPQIGCGLAGGDWTIVQRVIQRELKDMIVEVVIYKP